VVMTPVTYRMVAKLKKAESEDHYDTATNFTPFSLRI
jgi:queuosine precursor transporter